MKKDVIHSLLALLFAFIVSLSCSTESPKVKNTRSKSSFNSDWVFALATDSSSTFSNEEINWQPVKIPHDWSIEGEYDENNPSGHFGGYLPGGIGLYKKVFQFEKSWKDKLISIVFDGIYMNSEVWINGNFLGKRPFGYVTFTYDLTPYLKEGENELNVKVDNSAQPNSRWYTGSGIYRNVWLHVKDKVSVIHWGTQITNHEITTKSAKVKLNAQLQNLGEEEAVVEAVAIFKDPSGKVALENSETINIAPKDTVKLSFDDVISTPVLWSLESPEQYTCNLKLKVGEKIVDNHETRFGIRSIRFEVETGFWLNDKNIKIKGVNNHHDGGPVGAAVPNDVLHRRLVILKEMGCNAIRTAHNPFAPEFYDMCDSMGFLVMDEVFDEWIASWPWVNYKNQGKVKYGYHLYFDKWSKKDLTDIIIRDRNHPSIIMWSVGNEIPDQCYAEGPVRLKPLLELAHKLDSTRPVTAGCCFMHLANESGFSSLLDVAGYNGGGGSVFYEKDKAVYPNRKFIATEIPHSFQTRGTYKTTTEMRSPHQGIPLPNLREEELFPEFSKFYSSSYDNSSVRISARDSWRRTDSLPYVAGEFRWTGFDYLGEAIKKWPSRFWNFGIIDLCGFPKDHFYYYKSKWTDKPMVHILPHWTWPGKEGKSIPVWTYSNAEKVELFLNGETLGAKTNTRKMNLSWDVPYTPGELKAIAYVKGEEVAQMVYNTAGTPAKIQLLSDRKNISANGESCIHVEVNILDEKGNLVPSANNLVKFVLAGPVDNIGVENGDPLDLGGHKINQRKAFHGKCLIILQNTGESGEITLKVESDGLPSEEISFSCK